jgi:hypothetical protein
MTHPKCKLCQNSPADKKNSHIIPKFMCKGLFEATKPRHALSINRQGKGKKIQDTPKEDNILCKTCEKRIEILETYFARIIQEIHTYKNLPEQFTLSQLGTQQYLECNHIHPTLFKLFLYSLVWRTSISNLFEYLPFNLNKQDEEIIRVFLNSNLSVNKALLLKELDNVENIPFYHSCIIKPKEKSASSRGIFSVASMSETSHILLLIDFAIFFYTDEISIGNVLERFSNKQNEKVIVTLGETEPWLGLNQLYLSKMLNEKNGS